MTKNRSNHADCNDMISMRQNLEAGRTTSAALVERAIERAEEVNDRLNFIALPTFDRARQDAQHSHAGPLSGIPTLIKDMLAEKGLPNCRGSEALRDYRAPENEPYTQAMANAGLISIARSTMPELGLNVVTESPLVGITRNPWSLDHTPGGSSGGGAAAVAAGVVPIAHASDGLGSIRHGAAPCGLVGLKPSRGRNVGDENMRTIADLNVNGCVSRTVRDTAAWLKATQTKQPNALFAPVPMTTEPVTHSLRIGTYSTVMRTGGSPDANVCQVFTDTIHQLEQLGHHVSDTPLPFCGPSAIATLNTIIQGMFPRRIDALSKQIGIELTPEKLEHRSASLIAAGKQITDQQFEAAWHAMGENVAAYLEQFHNIDIWMTPTFSTEIVRTGVFAPDIPWLMQKEHLYDYAGYCWIDNFAGTPAISLPMGFSANGLPVGIQFATRPGGEALLLALAYQLEAANEWWRHTPPIWVGE